MGQDKVDANVLLVGQRRGFVAILAVRWVDCSPCQVVNSQA